MISFINNKSPDLQQVSDLLAESARVNHWANRGPLYHRTAEAFAEHMNIPAGSALVPCANGGIAFEALARLQELQAGRKLRWVGSGFSFHNLGRGYFFDMAFVDPDAQGLLDLRLLEALDTDSYDGITLVNPLGLAADFSAYIAFASRTGKALLIDNAAGIGPGIPQWPWQSFSLHHTKPYGFGEGGMALVPVDLKEELYTLLDYGECPKIPRVWLNNGKVSDIACAFHLSWLMRREEWAPGHIEQARRIDAIARDMGLHPLLPLADGGVAMSRAYLSEREIPIERVRTTRHAKYAKYYKPLDNSAVTLALYDSLVNIPCHPDMAGLSDFQIREDIRIVLGEAN